jgi:hypothetical protein
MPQSMFVSNGFIQLIKHQTTLQNISKNIQDCVTVLGCYKSYPIPSRPTLLSHLSAT